MEQLNHAITEDHLLQFEQDGFMLFKNVLNDDENLAIASFVKKQHEKGQWSKAQIGKGADSMVNWEQRGDFIEWLDPENSNIAIQPYWRLLAQIQLTLNRHFYLGLNFFESHMACYPEGTFYKRHSDQHKNGSTRKVSFVYYLNENWIERNGGLLKIFDEDETKATIIPLIGHCIVFLSDLEHEVTISQLPRYSITGWFHQK